MFIFRTYVKHLVVLCRTIYARRHDYLGSCRFSSGDMCVKFIPTGQLLFKKVLVHSLACYGVQSYTRIDLRASSLLKHEAE
jgi:hypothetical protein